MSMAQVWDATRPINEDATLKLLTWDDNGRKIHFLAFLRPPDGRSRGSLFPGVKFWVGPPVEKNGFYYDMDLGGKAVSPKMTCASWK